MTLSAQQHNWPEIAHNLSQSIPASDFHPKVLHALKADTSPWGIACSGGLDSLALLLLIYAHLPSKRNQLHILHYNHKTRPTADSDAQFLQTCAQSLELPIIVGNSTSSDNNRSEDTLRQERHAFFHQALKQIQSQRLLLGHHSDDVLESILMRLARGSGTAGLAAPRPLQCFNNRFVYLRPLIHLPKKTLETTLTALNIPWHEDASNQSPQHFRNRVRQELTSAFKKIAPKNLLHSINRSRHLLEEDDNALNQWLNQLLPIAPTLTLELSPLKGKPIALYRRALHRWLQMNNLGKTLNATSFDTLLQNIFHNNPAKISLGPNTFLHCKHNALAIQKTTPTIQWNATPFVPGTTVFLPDGKQLDIALVFLTDTLKNAIFSGNIDPARQAYLNTETPTNFYLRLWQPGDRYHPLGAPGSKKLKAIFIDKKIIPNQRKTLPLICKKESEIAWCPGLPIAERFKILLHTSHALRLTYS